MTRFGLTTKTDNYNMCAWLQHGGFLVCELNRLTRARLLAAASADLVPLLRMTVAR